jgi:hypothetical protein
MFAVKFPFRFSWLVSQIHLSGICGLLYSPICSRDDAAHIRILSSVLYFLRVFLRMFRTVDSALLFFLAMSMLLMFLYSLVAKKSPLFFHKICPISSDELQCKDTAKGN